MRPRVKISRIHFLLFAVPDVYDSVPSTVYVYGKMYIYYSVAEGTVKEWTKTCIYDETGAELKCMDGVPLSIMPIYFKVPVKIPVPQSTITKKITVKIYYTREGMELLDEYSATASIDRDIIYKSILPNIVSADITPDRFVRCPGLELGEYAGKLVYSFVFNLSIRLAFPPLSDLDYKPIEVKPYICSNMGVKIYGRWYGKCHPTMAWPDVVKGETTYSKQLSVIPNPYYSEARFGYTIKYDGHSILEIIGGKQRMISDVLKIGLNTGLQDKIDNIKVYTPTIVLTRTDSTWTYRKEPYTPPPPRPKPISISRAYIEAPPRVDVNEKFTVYLVVGLDRDITEYEAKNIAVKIEINAYKKPAVIPLVRGEIKLEKPGKTYTISIDTVFKSPGLYNISGFVSLVPLGDVSVSTGPVPTRPASIRVVEKPEKPPEEKPLEADKRRIAAAIAIATIIGTAVAIGVRK